MRGPGPGYAAWLRDLARPGAPVRLGLAAGDHLDVDEIGLQVLWPIRGQVPATPPDGGTGINNVSVVLLGQVGQRRFLLMGDVEEGIDPSLLTDGPAARRPPQGRPSRQPDGDDAGVRRCRRGPRSRSRRPAPGTRTAIPAKATLDRLAASGARVLRTDRDGTVVVGFEAGGMTVRAEGGRSIAADAARPRSAHGRRRDGRRRPQRPPRSCARSRSPRLVPAAAPPAEPASAAAGADPARPPSAVPRPSGTIEAMTVPGRVDAASLLLSLDPPPWFVRHARAVAEVAGWLAARIEARGIARRSPPGRVGRAAPRRRQGAPGRRSRARPPARRRVGGVADQAGHPELARAVASHPVTRLLDGERYRRWAAFASREERIVAYADKRAGQRLEIDGGAVRLVASPLSAARRRRPGRRLGRRRPARRPGACRPARGGRLPRRRGPRRTRSAAWAGPARPSGSPEAATHRHVRTPVDDHGPARVLLGRRRAVRRARGRPVRGRARRRERRRRWTAGSLRGNRNMATGLIGELHERVATPVMFGGGTLAVVMNPGALVVKGEDRDAFLAAIGLVAPGNALVILDASESGAKAPGTEAARRCRRRGRRHGPPVQVAPRAARSRAGSRPRRASVACTLAPGTAKTLAERVGGFVQRGRRRAPPADPDRLDGARQARPLPRRRRRSAPDDVTRARRRGRAGLGLGVHRCRRRAARGARPRRPRPAARDDAGARPAGRPPSSRPRADRDRRSPAAGERLPAIGKAMGVSSEFRMEKLRDQARLWTTDELIAALDGLVELDAMVKGVPGWIGSRRSDGWRSACG